MSRAFVVDANVFKMFFDIIIHSQELARECIIGKILANDFIAVDDGGKILHEWRECSCGEDYDAFEYG